MTYTKKCCALLMAMMLFVTIIPSSIRGLEMIDTSLSAVENISSIKSSLDKMEYALPPDHLYPFIYDGTPPSTWREIDTSNCKIGCLYVYDENTKEVCAIGSHTIITHASTKDHIFYITDNQMIYQTDYTGSYFTLIYQSDLGNIDMLQTFGNFLYFVEKERGIIVFDINAQAIHAFFANDSVTSAYMFDDTKLIWWDANELPYYFDTVSKQNVELANDNEVSNLIKPYILPISTNGDMMVQSSAVINNVGVPDDYNNIAFPLVGYEAVPERKGYEPTVVLKKFKNADGTKKCYASSYECDGFAKYAHDVFWHIEDWSRTVPSWDLGNTNTADYHSNISWNSQADMIDIFEGLSRGAFVRYVSKQDATPDNGTHSYVFDGIDSDNLGMWHYECNQDFDCGIGYQYYTFSLYYSKNKKILYYVDHEVSTNSSCANATYHKLECANCNGYLLREHEGAPYVKVNAGTSGHRASYNCCSGYVTISHTGTVTYTRHSTSPASGHYVTYSCCSGSVLVPHTYRNQLCTACAYRNNTDINSHDVLEEK